MTRRHPSGKARSARWPGFTDESLLALRFCDLKLRIPGSPLQADLDQLHDALARRGIRFKPHAWLSTEWFSPDGIPGIAVPFYAADPRLAQLERRMKGEAEGASRAWRRRILRHEAGHALDTAFGLRRRADWRALFGRASRPYPNQYLVKPTSRRYVQHLGHWYAQSHPTEDFAETFAVWLQPRARWRRDYAGWPALEKLEFVDELMAELAGSRPRRVDRSIVGSIHNNRRTLREHYRRNPPGDSVSDRRYDTWLQRSFHSRFTRPDRLAAARYLGDIRADLQRTLARRTGAGRYLIDHVVDTLRKRARDLDLVIPSTQREAKRRSIRLHERVIDDLLRRNRERYVL